MRLIAGVLILLLAGCANKQPIVIEVPPKKVMPLNTVNIEHDVQIVEEKPAKHFKNTGELLEFALKDSRQKPEADRFLNAATLYDYIPSSIYQIYTAPLKVTMLSFEKGEKIVSPPQGGDTVRWQLSTINSGSGADTQQHLIIKPLRDGLKNNVIIVTNKGRIYLLELISLKNSYMAEVKWNYPKNFNLAFNVNPNVYLKAQKEDNQNYKIKNISGKPIWKPVAVHDDGYKTFIKFSDKVKQDELPALYIVTKESRTQLVNYRVKNNQMIIDRLFNIAELRLGLNKPQIVRITRKG